jgi:ethanolamine utilization protein EutA
MHDAEFPHNHEELYQSSEEIEGLEKIVLTSVGIDIGSSTSHLLFSRLTLRRQGGGHSAQFSVVDRAILWSSPIFLTPYLSQTQIDFDKVKAFIHRGYHDAGLTPARVDTGAVVITGEALKKENARPIVEHFSGESGKFICASAGPHHEALLAAYGSGAVRLSKDSRGRILNVDMGGGTTKLSLIQGGEILETAAISIGARLIAFDADGRITRLEEAGEAFARLAGIAVAPGSVLSAAEQARIGAAMGEALVAVLQQGFSGNPLAPELMVTDPLTQFTGIGDVDYVIFSGGVSEYIYGKTESRFGDLGAELGTAIRSLTATLPRGTVLEPVQGIRATVIGASEYTIQVSGATCFSNAEAHLPIFGHKVVCVRHRVGEEFSASLALALKNFDVSGFGPGIVVSLAIEGMLDYAALREIAGGLAELARQAPWCPLVVTIEQDIARSIGIMLANEYALKNPLICVDGIAVGDLDFIDIGKPIGMMQIFPVTVKTLLFAPQRTL